MRPLSLAIGILIGATLFITTSVLIAWTGPTSAPPNGNVDAPLNVGTIDQVKDGGLGINSLAVFGNAIINGASRYLNFGTIPGETGYGIRDNGGTMQFKNNNESWANIATSSGAAETDPQVGTLSNGQWCTSDGTAVNCTNTAPTGGVGTCTIRSSGFNSTSQTVSCVGSEKLTGGGCESLNTNTTNNVASSFPESSTTWRCWVPPGYQVKAYGICCN